ncbi:thioredoxin family protein [Macrococcus animalis]|uniref:thioredoxin family protein n=1 Tax=Macrococcus animalis TaxID=3395467 RepID=UPI0039BDBEA0
MIKYIQNNDLTEMPNLKQRFVILNFTASWCGPCKMFHPVLEKLDEKYNEHIQIVKVDIDKNRALALQFEILSVPTTIIIDNGKELQQLAGFIPLENMEYIAEDLIHPQPYDEDDIL